MAISDDLNSIRTHLEDDYTALETLGVSVEDRNIENIKDMANQIYAKFPKTDYAEGSNITLSNTLKGKLDFEDGIVGYGDTSQDTTEGYNLLNPSKVDTSSPHTITKVGATRYKYIKNVFGTTSFFTNLGLESAEYTVSFQLISGTYSGGNLVIRDSNNTSLGEITISGSSKLTKTLTGAIDNLVFWSCQTTTNCVFDIQIERGSTSHNFEEYTGGQASPSPSYPQDIEVVRGKNILDSELEKGTYNDNTGEQITTDGNYRNVSPIKVCPNTTYTFSINGVKQRYCVYYYDSSNNFISWIPAETGTFTTPNNCYYINFRCYVADYTSDFANLKIQLEKGSTATSYLPYNTLEVVERGKNLLPNNWTSGSISSSTGEAVAYGSRIYTTNKIKVKPNTTYIINNNNTSSYSIRNLIDSYTSNGTHIERIGDIANGLTFTTSANVGYINITLADPSDTLRYENFTEYLTNGTLKPILAEGTDDTYEPYQTPQTYQLSLGEYEFAKIGNYVDTIEYDVDEDKVYKNKAIDKVSLKTLTWVISLVGTNSYGTASLLNYIGKIATDINIICSHATGIIFNDRNRLTNTTIYDETNGFVVFRNTSFTSLEDFTTFLNNNNVYAYYVLATATREEITTTLKDQIKEIYNIMSLNGTTIIEIDGQLPLIIKVRALKGE